MLNIVEARPGGCPAGCPGGYRSAAASNQAFCDRLDRRRFIQIGGLGALGFTLADYLRAAQAAGLSRSDRQLGKSVILIWQHGGPSQFETFDMKPDAPREVRGPYRSIPTTLPGLRIAEHMPFHARVMDRATIIRSFTHGNGDHFAASHWMLSGYLGATGSDRVPRHPSMASTASYLLGARVTGAPSCVNINDGGFGFHGAAFLGVQHNPFRIGDYSYGNEGLPLPSARASSLELVDGLSDTRLMNRVALAQQFDAIRRRADEDDPQFRAVDDLNKQALELILSGRTRRAFDLAHEDAATRERYGPGWGEQALLARRLIEAGVRFVTLNTGYWDDHGNIKGRLDDKLPRHDRAVGVLIEDLADRGLLEDTLVVTAGEFGRTPTINKHAGRDHWPRAQSILFAGGGFRHGQVIGSTNDKAEYPTSRPIGPADFSAIIYHALGLAPTDTVPDRSGRPHHLLPGGEVPVEML